MIFSAHVVVIECADLDYNDGLATGAVEFFHGVIVIESYTPLDVWAGIQTLQGGITEQIDMERVKSVHYQEYGFQGGYVDPFYGAGLGYGGYQGGYSDPFYGAGLGYGAGIGYGGYGGFGAGLG